MGLKQIYIYIHIHTDMVYICGRGKEPDIESLHSCSDGSFVGQFDPIRRLDRSTLEKFLKPHILLSQCGEPRNFSMQRNLSTQW